MKQRTKPLRIVGVAALCVALGAAGGIASGGAATTKASKANSGPPRRSPGRARWPRRP